MEPDQKTLELSTEELRKILVEKSATVFDARPFNEYAVSHIPGAVNVSAKPGVPISLYVSDVSEIGRVVQDNKAAPIALYCNGPFCGKSKRLAEELLAAGYTNVRRYQLGIPVWRALGGITEIEAEGVQYVREKDQTAVWIDARDPEEFTANPIPNARNLPLSGVKPGKDMGEVKKAKTMGACRWKTTTRALSCSGAMEPRPEPLRKRSPGKPSITCPTLLGHLRGFGLRQSVSSSSPTPAVRQAHRLTKACSRLFAAFAFASASSSG